MPQIKSQKEIKFKLFGILFSKQKGNIYLKFEKPISFEAINMIPQNTTVITKEMKKQLDVEQTEVPKELIVA